MKILVTGAAGQLGFAVVRELAARGHDVIGSIRRNANLQGAGRYVKLDLLCPGSAGDLLRRERPDVLVHCAA